MNRVDRSADRLGPFGVNAFNMIVAALCFSTWGVAFGGVEGHPMLIDGAIADAPDEQSVLGKAEQGRWLAFIHPQALALVGGTRKRGVDSSTGPAVGVRFAVDLPERGRLELVVDNLTEVVDGVTTMTGSLADEADGDFVLSLEGDKLLGTIEEGTHIWLIEPDERGPHLLRKVHRGLIPRVPDDEDYRIPQETSEPRMRSVKSAPTPLSGTNGGVDVLFLYASNVTNPSLRASDIVGRFTLVRNNSLISTNNSITSVGVYPVSSNFSGLKRSAVIAKMEYRTAPFTQIDDWMLHTNADVSFLLLAEDPTVSGDVAGYGRVGGLADIYSSGYPFGLSTVTYALGDNSAIHELGHVFGGHQEDYPHSISYVGAEGEGSNHPVVAPNCSWMTIMGGYTTQSGCPFVGLPATTVRINYFSNPALNPAAAGGNVIGVVGAADMESVLESSMPTVSAWRNNGGISMPAAPNSMSHLNLQCWGDNIISWASVSGATQYKVFQSTRADFAAPTQVYQGSGLSVGVWVPTSGAYHRVHACNSTGCSNWTGTEYAPWFNGCP